MSTTYKWTITSLSTMPSPPAPIDNYVVGVKYTVKGTNGTNTASIDSSAQFPLVESPTLVPYASLTKEDVLDWVKGNSEVVSVIQANIDKQLALLANPPVVSSEQTLPWSA